MRTVNDVINDLNDEAAFMGRCGLVPTANLLKEAVYYLKKIQRKENGHGDDGRKRG